MCFVWLGFFKLGFCCCHLPSNKVQILGFNSYQTQALKETTSHL